MRNVDKYKDELIKMANESSIVQIDTGFEDRVISGSSGMDTMTARRATRWFVKWLYEQDKFKLNKWEHLIFQYLAEDTKYKYIARDKSNCVYVYENKPLKMDDCWNIHLADGKCELLYCLSDLFLFVRWEDDEPKLIEDILDNCEVVDDD